MRRLLLALALAACDAAPLYAATPPCCTPSEVQTLRDLVYIAKQTAPDAIIPRLITLSQALAANPAGWNDPDKGLILGYIAATGDGIYWRALIQDYAHLIGVAIKPIGQPQPLPPPPPDVIVPPGGGAIVLDNPPEIILRNTTVNPAFSISIFMSRNDNGLRVNWNWCTQPGNPYESFCDPFAPQVGMAIESDGAISFGGRRKFIVNGSVLPPGPYDYGTQYANSKALKFYPLGYNCGTDQACKYTEIVSSGFMRGMQFSVVPDSTNINLYLPRFSLDTNGVQVYVGGSMRQLIICPGTTNQLCVQ